MIYLDNSATTRVLKEAAETAAYYSTEKYFNPAALYSPAVSAEKDMETARRNIARLLGSDKDEILYTSGGTESNNMALFGCLKRKKPRPGVLVTDQVEHPSVHNVFKALEQEGYTVKYAENNPDGTVNIDHLSSLLSDDTLLVSVMHVNNELGSVNDLTAVRKLVRSRTAGAVFHSDGVQAFCKTPFQNPPCDLYSVSGHKLHAPKGVGFLYVRKGTPFSGGQLGGGQERNLRSGTSNVPSIMALDTALHEYRDHMEEWNGRMLSCKLRLLENLKAVPDCVRNGPEPSKGAPHILNVSFYGVRGEVLVNALSEKGICVSTGSACSEKLKGHNRILTAVGITGERQEGAVRFSFSHFNTIEEMDTVSGQIEQIVSLLRKYRRR